jgi:hypothetical protein
MMRYPSNIAPNKALARAKPSGVKATDFTLPTNRTCTRFAKQTAGRTEV